MLNKYSSAEGRQNPGQVRNSFDNIACIAHNRTVFQRISKTLEYLRNHKQGRYHTGRAGEAHRTSTTVVMELFKGPGIDWGFALKNSSNVCDPPLLVLVILKKSESTACIILYTFEFQFELSMYSVSQALWWALARSQALCKTCSCGSCHGCPARQMVLLVPGRNWRLELAIRQHSEVENPGPVFRDSWFPNFASSSYRTLGYLTIIIETRVRGKKSLFIFISHIGSALSEQLWCVDVLLYVRYVHIYVNFVTSLFPFFGTWGEEARRSGILLIVLVPGFGRVCSMNKLDRPFLGDMKDVWPVQPKAPPQKPRWACYTLSSKYQLRFKRTVWPADSYSLASVQCVIVRHFLRSYN